MYGKRRRSRSRRQEQEEQEQEEKDKVEQEEEDEKEKVEEKKWCLRDLGSTNGTFLNGKRLKSRVYVNDDDVISVGKSKIKYTAQQLVISEPSDETAEKSPRTMQLRKCSRIFIGRAPPPQTLVPDGDDEVSSTQALVEYQDLKATIRDPHVNEWNLGKWKENRRRFTQRPRNWRYHSCGIDEHSLLPPLSPTKVRSRRSKSRGRRRRKSQRRGTVAFAEGPILSPQTENCPSAINVKTPHHVHFTRRKKRYIGSIAKFARTPPEEEMAAKDRMNVHLLTLSSVKTLDFGEPTWFSKRGHEETLLLTLLGISWGSLHLLRGVFL